MTDSMLLKDLCEPQRVCHSSPNMPSSQLCGSEVIQDLLELQALTLRLS